MQPSGAHVGDCLLIWKGSEEPFYIPVARIIISTLQKLYTAYHALMEVPDSLYISVVKPGNHIFIDFILSLAYVLGNKRFIEKD